MKRPLIALSLLLASTLPGITHAADPALSVQEPYVRLAPPNAPATGAFMVIRNAGNNDRKLVKADSPVSKVVELHNHINENGVMKMRQVQSIDVKAHGEAVLKPGSYHVMLIEMRKPLAEDQTIPITLSFDDGSTLEVAAPVRKLQMTMPSGSGMKRGEMKH